MNKRRNIVILTLIFFLILSQWLMVKLVYTHKIKGTTAKLLANVYQLKAGSIEEAEMDIDIYLKDFFRDKEFANKLLVVQASADDKFVDIDVSDKELSDLVWDKLLKQAWLNKVAKENNIEINQEDIDYYINILGGQDKLKELVESQGISVEEYKYFIIEADVLELKVYNHLLENFEDERGVLKIQEAYALLETENGKNWDVVVEQYGEDTRVSENNFWLAEDELLGAYEAIKEIDGNSFSKIVQLVSPEGYVIWHLESIVQEAEATMREVNGLFVYAQNINDFFDTYIKSVNIKRNY